MRTRKKRVAVIMARLRHNKEEHSQQPLPKTSSSSIAICLSPCWYFIILTLVQSQQATVQAFTRDNALSFIKTSNTNAYCKTLHTVEVQMYSSRTWIDGIGSSALRNVENLAQSVTRANDEGLSIIPQTSSDVQSRNTGDTGTLFNRAKDKQGLLYDRDGGIDKNGVILSENGPLPITVGDTVSTAAGSVISTKGKNRKVVLSALESLERDMQLLDNITAQKPQLSRLEITLLSLSVVVAGSGPVFFMDGAKVAEVLAPACAACKYITCTCVCLCGSVFVCVFVCLFV